MEPSPATARQLIDCALSHLLATLEASNAVHRAAWHPTHSLDDTEHNHAVIDMLRTMIATRHAEDNQMRRSGATQSGST